MRDPSSVRNSSGVRLRLGAGAARCFGPRGEARDGRLDVAQVFVRGALGLPAQRLDGFQRARDGARAPRYVRHALAQLLVLRKQLGRALLRGFAFGRLELVKRREDALALGAQTCAPLGALALARERLQLAAQLAFALVQALDDGVPALLCAPAARRCRVLPAQLGKQREERRLARMPRFLEPLQRRDVGLQQPAVTAVDVQRCVAVAGSGNCRSSARGPAAAGARTARRRGPLAARCRPARTPSMQPRCARL